MSKSEFGEPWKQQGGCVGETLDIGDGFTGMGDSVAQFEDPRKAKRATKCTNALDGRDPAVVGEFIEAAKHLHNRIANQNFRLPADVVGAWDRLKTAIAKLEGNNG